MLKKLFTFVCVAFMAMQANAAQEERILLNSTNTANWEDFKTDLAGVKFGTVPGYDPGSDTLYTAALVVWVCQNQAHVWQQACANKPERISAFKARNGLGDTITGAELQVLGQGKGIFFPFGAVTVAAAPAPAVAAAAAPVVAAVPAITAEQMKQIAMAAVRKESQASADALQALNNKMDSTLQSAGREVSEARAQAQEAKAAANLAVNQAAAAASAATAFADKAGVAITQVTAVAKKLAGEVPDMVAKATDSAASASVKAVAGEIGRFDSRVSDGERNEIYLASGLALIAFICGGGLFWSFVISKRQKSFKASTGAAFTALGDELDVVREETAQNSAALPQSRTVQFPEQCNLLVMAISMNAAEDPRVVHLKISGLPKDMMPVVTVSHAKPGYVLVGGVPGHDPKEPVLFENKKRSKSYNGFELLIMGAARRGAFDPKTKSGGLPPILQDVVMLNAT